MDFISNSLCPSRAGRKSRMPPTSPKGTKGDPLGLPPICQQSGPAQTSREKKKSHKKNFENSDKM